jgi:UDP-N-acetylmuramyl pentapeptide synthase
MLPVFYAGGTTSFNPESGSLTEEFKKKSVSPEKYLFFENRQSAEKFILEKMSKNDSVLVCGARDNSLADWCEKLCP